MSIALPHSASIRRSDSTDDKILQARAHRLAQAAYPSLAGGTDGDGQSPSAYAKPIGLVNEGNTCYLNSTFQALAASKSLINLLAPVIVTPKTTIGARSQTVDSSESNADESGAGDDGAEGSSNLPEPPEPLLADPFIASHSPYSAVAINTGGTCNDPNSTVYVTPNSIPSLRDEALEPENAKLLPVTFAFERALGRAWKAKDAAAGAFDENATPTDKARANKEAEQKSLSLKTLLKELSQKYDQYDEYRQQDAQELLRHLLDSMSMEEKDVIKRMQPPPPEEETDEALPGRRRRRLTRGDSISKARKAIAGDLGQVNSGRMVPFADALFGGSLVSVVVCEGCKNVSHTYEGFLDISLSMREQAPRVRKRDRFKAIAQKLRPGVGGKGKAGEGETVGVSPPINLEGIHSDAGGSGGEENLVDEAFGTSASKDSKSDTAVADSPSDTSVPRIEESSSNVVRKRSSLSWGIRKSSLKASRSSSIESGAEKESISSENIARTDSLESSGSSLPAGNRARGASRGSQSSLRGESPRHDSNQAPRPTPAQAAYIRRVLNGPNLPPKEDPLAKLRNGMAQMHHQSRAQGQTQTHNGNPHLPHLPHHPHHTPLEQVAEEPSPQIDGMGTDLMECLRAFTATEVLEGDNAFACHQCWRIQMGRYKPKKRMDMSGSGLAVAAEEEDEDEDENENEEAAKQAPRTIGIDEENGVAHAGVHPIRKDGPIVSSVPSITVGGERVETNHAVDEAGSGRATTTSRHVRMLEENDKDEGAAALLSAPAHQSKSSNRNGSSSIASNESSHSLSVYSTSEEGSSDEGRAILTIARPPMPARRKSTHFVMRRAIKRYMIARAPPILVFHFKRFQQSGKHQATNMYMSTFASLKKIDDYVSFPEKLDLSPFIAPRRSDYKIEIGADGVGRAKYLDHPPGDKGPKFQPMRYRLYGEFYVVFFFFFFLTSSGCLYSSILPVYFFER